MLKRGSGLSIWKTRFRRAGHFGVVGCQNQIKNGRVMPIESWGKSGVLAYFWLKIGYSDHIFWDMDFKLFVLPIIYIYINVKTQLEVILTLWPLWSPKTIKMVISQYLSCHFGQLVSITKIPTPPTFFNLLVWNFQNQCKYGFRK